MTTSKHRIEENKIEMTDNYNLFKSLKGNRSIDRAHVAKLMKAMRANDLFTPIIVNDKFEVIDGQHRLEARKQLGYIVPYFVAPNYGLEEIQAINSQQKKWSIADYTQSYIALGKKDYEVCQWFKERYKLPHIVSISLLAGMSDAHGTLSNVYNSGNFKVKDLEAAKKSAEMLEQIAPHFSGYNERSFVRAFFTVADKKVFSLKQFIAKLVATPNVLQKRATTDQYIDLIEEVYNYRSQSKVSLRYSE